MKMTVNDFSTIIGTLGFPIASCCFLAWYMSTTLKEFRTTIEANSKLIQELILIVKERGFVLNERREENDGN